MEDILVEVTCRVPGYENIQVGVTTSERNTIAGVIRKACKETKIPLKSSYTLSDSRNNILQWSHTLVQCGVKHGDILYLGNCEDDVSMRRGCRWSSWWFVAAICLLIGGLGVTAITILISKNGEQEYGYGVVFDAGSSHTKMFVYKWNGEKLHETALAHQIDDCTVKGNGLTSYVEDPANLTGPLTECLEQAKRSIPSDKHKDTPVFLGATAGMRMLQEVNSTISETIMSLVQQVFQQSSFQYQSASQARIISGQEEGTFGWITANYIAHKLGVDPPRSNNYLGAKAENTVGALDMGGASTQITFYSPEYPSSPDYREDLDLYGTNYTVYTHSYLCYGINEAIRRYMAILVHNQEGNRTSNGTSSNITNPCGPLGNVTVATYADVFEAPCANTFAGDFSYLRYTTKEWEDQPSNFAFYGTGNETQCHSYVEQLFNFSAPCPTPPCTFNGTYQPPVHGQFYAFSSFFYEMDFLNLTQYSASFPLDKFETELSKLCNTPWSVVSTMKAGQNGSMLGWYCFEGHYIHTLLTQAYKFDNQSWNNIQFIRQINKTDIGWTLGYMLNSSTTIPPAEPVTYISITAFSALTALFVIFVLLSVAFGCHARSHRDRGAGLYEKVPSYGAV